MRKAAKANPRYRYRRVAAVSGLGFGRCWRLWKQDDFKSNPVPFTKVSVGEYYWGYGSGVVATKVPDWGEFVLAELTQPFNKGDTTYFQPLMADTERRLGHKPHFGAFDAAFDAFYVYDYFHQTG